MYKKRSLHNDLKYTTWINSFLCEKRDTKIHSEHRSLYLPNIQYVSFRTSEPFFIPNISHFLFRTAVTLRSEHPVFFIPNIWTVFIPNIRQNDIMLYSPFRTSSHFVRCSEEQGRKGTHPSKHTADIYFI